MWVKNVGVLGPSSSQGDAQSVICLKRSFRWVRGDGGPDAVDIEPGELFAKGCKTVVTPGVKGQTDGQVDLLPLGQHIAFRSACIRAAYIAEYRIDIRYDVKELF